MTSTISWELYHSFLGVLREGSLSGAARSLALAQPTIGRHIDALEQALAVVLFTRSQVGLLPTEEALALRNYAEAMESAAAALERAATGHVAGVNGIKGIVRVTASEVIGVEVLPPIITRLRDQYPGVTLELTLTDRIQDLSQREADIAVRMVRPQQDLLVARRIGEIELGLHARKSYLERYGTPSSIDELRQHALIGFDQITPFIRSAARNYPWMLQREIQGLRADSHLAHLAMIRAGGGIGICQVPLARRDDMLVRLLPEAFAPCLETWITMHEDLRNSPRCRVVFDALVEGLQQYAA